MKILTKAIIGLTAAGATYALVQKRKRSETAEKKVEVDGFVRPGFEAVQEAFAKNFAKRSELGGACSVPSGGGVGTARAIAHAYGVFASVGMELGLSPKTLQELNAQEIPAANGFYDECLLADTHFLLGFMKSSLEFPFGSPGSFGAPGAGGSIGFADPAAQIGYAYVTNRIGTTLGGDPRDTALREALYKSTPVTDLSSAANKFANLSISP